MRKAARKPNTKSVRRHSLEPAKLRGASIRFSKLEAKARLAGVAFSTSAELYKKMGINYNSAVQMEIARLYTGGSSLEMAIRLAEHNLQSLKK